MLFSEEPPCNSPDLELSPVFFNQSQAMYHCCLCISAPAGVSVHQLPAVQAFRPDHFITAAHHFVDTVMEQSFMQQAEQVA